MAEREPEASEGRRLRFRIGINLDDLIIEPHDIFGGGGQCRGAVGGSG
jgi:hypothetical protein